MPLEEARRQGAIALFGEKYGKDVRVVTIGANFDKELCGGTHVPSTGHIGRIALLSEGSIGSGVRRIDALVADSAYRFQHKEHALVSQLSTLVGGRPEELPGRVESLMSRLKEAEKKLAAAQQAALASRAAEIAASATREGDFLLVTADVGAVGSADALRSLALDVRGRLADSEPVVVAVAGTAGDRPLVVATTNAAARAVGAKAGALVRTAAAVLGGGGGGKDDLAQGGGQDVRKIDAALAAIAGELV